MDVPADIQEKANSVWADAVEQSRAEGTIIDVSVLIAQALLSERLAQKERDAKIAEETGKAYCRDHFVMMGPAGIAHKVALAIRDQP